MTTEPLQSSATIYQFPMRPRIAARLREESETSSDVWSPRTAVAASGAWYHDAAIQDTKRIGERP